MAKYNYKFLIYLISLGFLFFTATGNADSFDYPFGISTLTNQNATFKDTSNRTVILHGLNEMNKQPPYRPDTIGFDMRSIQFFNTYGFNVVRLGVYWAAIEPFPGVYNYFYLSNIKKTIELLRQNGIYTLIDFHQDGFSAKYDNGLGAPLWAALSTTQEGINAGFPVNLFGGQANISLATDQDFDSFWQNQVGPGGQYLQQRYLDMIKIVSKFTLYTRGIIGYDMMNEPFPGSDWHACYDGTKNIGCAAFDRNTLTPFYFSVVNAIRSVDKNRIIFYEPNLLFGGGAPSFVRAPKDANLGFSFHNYDTENPTLVFDNASEHVTSTGSVPFMTEFGAAMANATQLNQIVELADQNKISWTEWTYTNNPIYKFAHIPLLPDDQKEQGIVYDATQPLRGKNVKWERLYVLSRVYPQVVAGNIKEYQFNSTNKIFTLTFDTKNQMNQTISSNPYSKIFIPPFIYQHGYKIQIQGARVIKTRDENALVIRNNAQSNRVFVMIYPT